MKPVELDYKMNPQGFLEPVLEVAGSNQEIGQYGMRAMNYLKEEYSHRYSLLRAEGTLMEIMQKVNEEAQGRMEVLQEQMLKTDPIPNPQNFYESYKHREMIRTSAEEIVLHEIIYKAR
jgi:hypothetical protein